MKAESSINSDQGVAKSLRVGNEGGKEYITMSHRYPRASD